MELDTLLLPIDGCISKQKFHHDIVPRLNLKLGDLQSGGGSCDEQGLNHYMFECLSNWKIIFTIVSLI